ncbi:MAG: hypothetical protein Q7S02_06725 [bacterium]|nr:hypothetical protein [bacterium]
MQKLISAIVVTALVAGGGAFYGGTAYAKRRSPSLRGGQEARVSGGVRGDRARDGQGMMGFRGTFGARGDSVVGGEIIASDAGTVTIKLRDGGTRIVRIAPTTTVTKSVAGSVEDLATGTSIIVNGNKNSDESVTATTIQLVPTVTREP